MKALLLTFRGVLWFALALTCGSIGATAQTTAGPQQSVIRPGALNDIPQHLTEIGWDTDVASLFSIRYRPEKMDFEPGWSSWVTETMLQRRGFMTRARVDPWPPIFGGNASSASMSTGQLSKEDMQAFQAWCLRRAQAIPPIIVHSMPYVAPISGRSAVVLPFGLRPGTLKTSQRVEGVGFSEEVGLTLIRNADDDAATVPPEVIAALPPAGVMLETRVRWSDPSDNSSGLNVPSEPVSLRLVVDRRVLWEHRYGAGSAATDPQVSPPTATTATTPAPDIKF